MAAVQNIVKGWGDDDDSACGSEPELIGFVGSSSNKSVDLHVREPRYRLSYVKHPSTYCKTLHDVDGHVLVDDDGRPVNIFMLSMKEMMLKGSLICYHVPGRPGYRYFVSTKQQGEDFRQAKQRGHSKSTLPYHIYPDEPGCYLASERKYPTAY